MTLPVAADASYLIYPASVEPRAMPQKAPSPGAMLTVAPPPPPPPLACADPSCCPECRVSAAAACHSNVERRSLTRSAPDLLFTVSSRCPPPCSTASQLPLPDSADVDFLLPDTSYDVDVDDDDDDNDYGDAVESASSKTTRGTGFSYCRSDDAGVSDGSVFGRTFNTPV